jgi:hypothetical protein
VRTKTYSANKARNSKNQAAGGAASSRASKELPSTDRSLGVSGQPSAYSLQAQQLAATQLRPLPVNVGTAATMSPRLNQPSASSQPFTRFPSRGSPSEALTGHSSQAASPQVSVGETPVVVGPEPEFLAQSENGAVTESGEEGDRSDQRRCASVSSKGLQPLLPGGVADVQLGGSHSSSKDGTSLNSPSNRARNAALAAAKYKINQQQQQQLSQQGAGSSSHRATGTGGAEGGVLPPGGAVEQGNRQAVYSAPRNSRANVEEASFLVCP